ncbi:LOW QUALITY PROTEIN: NPH3 domain [Dillenia turbinata]|uniref:NPH3 domain n=1 Tax=Dillenia turbinata TaxID=194707 RepID=A0AAN8UGX9_9MAGN
MVSRSSYLNGLVFDRSNCERDSSARIQIDVLPGGPEIFELVVKFCYGWKVDLTAANVAPLYCAAHFLEMNTFRILKSCESISSWARELQIPKYCSEAVAWKACTNPRAISSCNDDAQCIDILANNSSESNLENATENGDVSHLRIDHFIEVIVSIKGKRMRPELVRSCVAYWTSNWLSQITFRNTMLRNKDMTYQAQRITTECLIRILPLDQNSVAFNFLLLLLKGAGIENQLQTRCHPQDLLIKNGEDEDPIYDVVLITRVIGAYVSSVSRNPSSKTFAVGRLVDEYLTLVAKDEKLKAKYFQSLAEALPERSRYCNDNLYRAIDMFLKAHPNLTEEERTVLCKAMDYHKLSQEAHEHMMKNDRLPLSFTSRFILFKQVNMARSMTAAGCNYHRTKFQTIMRVSRGLDKGWMKSQKEIKIMKQDVERIKSQVCRVELQKQVKRGIRDSFLITI